MRNKTRKVLLLVEKSHEYWRGLLRGIFAYNKFHGSWQFEWSEELCNIDFFKSRITARALSEFDGIVMVDRPDNDLFFKAKIPLVLIDRLRTYDRKGICQIATNDKKIAECAFEHLRDRGFENYAYIGYNQRYWSENRKRYFQETVTNAGFTCEIFPQSTLNRQTPWGHEQKKVVAWIKTLSKPVGLFCCNDNQAREAMVACHSSGIRIPDEVAIVGVDNDDFVCESAFPPLSSVSLNVEVAGYRAADLLNQRMKGVEITEIIFVDPTHVAARQSSEILAISDPVVLEAVRYILDNHRIPLSVEDVAEQLAISRRALHDKFKQVLDCGVHSYIKKVRTDKMKSFLMDTDWKINRIADYFGFTSPAHIATYFRSEVGVSPSAYRAKQKPDKL